MWRKSMGLATYTRPPRKSQPKLPPLPFYQPVFQNAPGQGGPRALGQGWGEYCGMAWSSQVLSVQEPEPPAADPPASGRQSKSIGFPHAPLLNTAPIVPCVAEVDGRVCPSHPIPSLAAKHQLFALLTRLPGHARMRSLHCLSTLPIYTGRFPSYATT